MCFILAPFYSSIKNLNAFIIFLDIVLLYFWIFFIILYYIFGYCLLYFWILNIPNIPKIFPSVPRLTRSSGAYSGDVDAGESGASRFFSQMHAKADLENESRLRACAAQRRSRRPHSELIHAVERDSSILTSVQHSKDSDQLAIPRNSKKR